MDERYPLIPQKNLKATMKSNNFTVYMHHYATYTLIIQLTIQEALFKQHLNKI